MSDSEQCSNRLELDLISLLVNFSCELGQIMTRYDFLWARWVILSNVRTDLELDLIISPNEVFDDIMVLASPPRPPIDPDDVNALTQKIFNGSLSKFI